MPGRFATNPAAPNRDGWLRGVAQIDGRVFEGGPAPPAKETVLRTDHSAGAAMTRIVEQRLEEVAARAGEVVDEIERVVVGKRAALELALCAHAR